MIITGMGIIGENFVQEPCYGRVQEPFTTGYFVTGMHTRMQVLLRLHKLFEGYARVQEAEYR